MIHAILRGSTVITAMLCLSGCSGAASNQSASDPTAPAPDDKIEPAATPASSDTAPLESDLDGNTASTEDSDKSASCGGKICPEGQSCIEYYGVTGKPLYTCGIPCRENEPNDGCPETMRCHVIPDGPTQCVKQ